MHLKNIGQVHRGAGSVEVEVNLVQDANGPFVQVGMTDLNVPSGDERTMFTRIPLDVAALWGHLAEHLDPRGYIDAGRLVDYAWDVYSTYRCRFAWCVADHTVLGQKLVHQGGTVRLMGLRVTPILNEGRESPEAPDERYEAMVKLHFDGGMIHELRPVRAWDLADILSRIEVAEIDQLAGVLRASAEKLEAAE